MNSTRNAVFLSGWEYNRLLQEDPFLPRNSALPGELLWHGAAHFWLFEKVYCTTDALDNERSAGDRLGWTTGKIFAELATGPDRFIYPIDLRDLDTSARDRISQIHTTLRADPEIDVRAWLQSPGDDLALDGVKTALLQPVLDATGSVLGASPITLKHWQPTRTPGPTAPAELAFLTKLSKPIAQQKNGLKLLSRPGQGLDARDAEIERHVRATIEAPHIPDLLAGDGKFAGPHGYAAYHAILEDHKGAYAASDEIMAAEWKTSKARLLKLRELAATYLWPQLHGQWLPELRRNPAEFLPEFDRILKEALRGPHLAPLLNLQTELAVTFFGSAFAYIADLVRASGGSSSSPASLLALGAAVSLALHAPLRDESKQIGPLAMFYQKARRL